MQVERLGRRRGKQAGDRLEFMQVVGLNLHLQS